MTRRFFILTAAVAVLLLGSGCGKGKAERRQASRTPSSGPAIAPPAIPGVDEGDSASDGLLVKAGPPGKLGQTYKFVETMDRGALRIICRIPDVRAALPKRKPVDFKGPYAIRDPKTVEPYKVIYDGIRQRGYDITNELEFYKDWNPPSVETPLNWLRSDGDHLAVNGVAIMLQGIEAGVS